jgi:hypothetical protein
VTQPADHPIEDRPTARREFLGQIAASAIVIAGTACAAPAAAGPTTAPTPAPTPPVNRPPQAPTKWDDSWFGRLTAKHKAVFDSPAFEDGSALWHASGYIGGMRDAAGAGVNDVQVVVVMRHVAVPMTLNDAMWAKYEIGKEKKIKDYPSDKFATRNPFYAAAPSSSSSARPAPPADRPQGLLSWLGSNGHILLGCDLAMRGFSFQMAEKTKTEQRVVYEELKANLVPGVILQPTGVYAVLRAQEAGCAFFKSS